MDDGEEEPIDHILEALEGLTDLSLVRILAYLAAEISSRAAEERVVENLAAAPWRLAQGRTKGKGKGKNQNGKGKRGREGPY